MKKEPEFVQQIVDMYSAGESQKKIVETTGQTYCVIRYWLKKKNLHDPNRRCQVKDSKRRALENLSLKLLSEGFGYVNGYENHTSNITITCFACGNSFERNAVKIKRDAIQCPFCIKTERERKKAEQKAARQVEYERKIREQSEYWKKYREQKEVEKQLEKDRIWDEVHVCPMCDRKFSIREYAEENGLDVTFIPTVTYCSKECRNKSFRIGHPRDHIKRAKKHGCEWESGVTLSKLIRRDGLTCALCGEPCDMNDKSYGNGSGPLYPSMDHIIPISKGGGHTWSNVQVAHIICNVRKNDMIV